MSQPELLTKVVRALDEVGIQYMVTGSIVSSLQGEPRSTHDIDFIVDIDSSSVRAMAEAFPPPEFHVDEKSILEAISQRGMFNIIEMNTGDKVDFWMLTDTPFDKSRFLRRYTEDIVGMKVKVSTPEDTILAKLWWAKLSGGSEKQLTDALRVYEVQYGKLDMGYLQSWAEKLSVLKMLQGLQNEAEIV